MIGIDAVPNTTKMIEMESFGNRANNQFVGGPMGTNGFAGMSSETSIAIFGEVSSPQPTGARFVHILQEAIHFAVCVTLWGIERLTKSGAFIMHRAIRQSTTRAILSGFLLTVREGTLH